MGDDSEQGDPARWTINPIGKQSNRAGSGSLSLSAIPTDLDWIYSELGGPVALRDGIERKSFAFACKEFRWSQVAPVLRRFQKDPDVAKRHWPWVALALSQYCFERKELQRQGAKLNPGEIIELLNNIRRSAKELANGLGRLQEYSHSVPDPVAPLRQPHLAYLDEFISQAAAGHIAAEVNQDVQHMLHVSFGKKSFMRRLIDVEVAAREAVSRMDPNLLKRKKGQGDSGLHNLVWRCAKIWESMTGRKASGHKVHTVDRDDHDDHDPDFVKFVQALVDLVGVSKPSRKQVELSLKNAAPPMATEKSE
jgi:hypothetical protein